MPLISLGCECLPECPPLGAAQGPPGPKGNKGDPGPTGPQGVNNFSLLEAPFTMPPSGQNANAQVTSTEWMGIGESLYVENAGYLVVVQFNSSQVVVLNNPGYDGNAPETTVAGVGSRVSGAGPQGVPGKDFILTQPLSISLGGTGQPTAALAFDALSPLTTYGQMLGFNGFGNTVLPPPPVNGDVLFSDNTTTVGFRWGPQSELVIDFNAFSPLHTKGDILVFNGTANVALPVGASGDVLSADSSKPSGLGWITPTFHTFDRVLVNSVVHVLNGTEDVVGVNHPSTPGPTQIVLAPLSFYTNTYVIIKDERGDADVNPITITTSDGSVIETNPSYTINEPFGHVWIYSDGIQFQIM